MHSRRLAGCSERLPVRRNASGGGALRSGITLQLDSLPIKKNARKPPTWVFVAYNTPAVQHGRSKEGSAMLVLSRKLGEKIYINDNICITVVDIDRGKIRLGIDAPRDVPIFRQELLTPPASGADGTVLAAKG
jgi:carbon storage regulator